MNNFGKRSDPALVKAIGTATTVLIEQYLNYGVAEAEVELLDEQNAALNAQIQLAANLEAQKRAAFGAKEANRDAALATLSALAGRIYSNPNVTDAMLEQIGFAPRPVRGTRSNPRPVTDLVATAYSNAEVVLKWKRNGNTRSTLFTIQFRPNGGNWQTVGSTIASKATLEGFVPGQAGTFRVRATVNGKNSAWSNLASIYVDNSTPAIRIAA